MRAALRSGESLGVGRFAFSSASSTKRSAASPVSTGIVFIAIAIVVLFQILLSAVVEDFSLQSYDKKSNKLHPNQ